MQMKDVNFETYFKNYPNEKGYFGKYGGSYVKPELQKAMDEGDWGERGSNWMTEEDRYYLLHKIGLM